jgi:hypothetical protein
MNFYICISVFDYVAIIFVKFTEQQICISRSKPFSLLYSKQI